MSYYIWQQLYQRSLHNAQNAAGAQPDRFEKRGFVKHLALAALVQKVVLALSSNTAGRKTNRWQKKMTPHSSVTNKKPVAMCVHLGVRVACMHTC